MRFQNGSNKVVIKLQVVQFLSEIMLLISNARSFDFEITRMISDQLALHSVQLPLFINSFDKTKFYKFYVEPQFILKLEIRSILIDLKASHKI